MNGARLGVGVIGAGVAGQLRIRTVARDPHTILRGVADVDGAAARAGARAGGAAAFTDYRRLLELPGVEALIISSPVHLHEQMAVAALEAGRHVLCEKPLANSAAACRRVLDAAAAARRVLAVGFNHRYYPCIRFLKQAVDRGLIGTLDHLRLFGGHTGLSEFRADWMYQGELSGGGAMMDVGIHLTDLARYIAGEIVQVYGVASGRIWNVRGSEDNALAIFTAQSGVPVSYQATWGEWKGYRLRVEAYGELGMVGAYYAPLFNLMITREKAGGRRRRTMRFYPRENLRERVLGWQVTARAAFAQELADFLRMIEGEQVALADGLAGLRAAEIAAAVYQSSAKGAAVRLGGAAQAPPARSIGEG